MNIKHTSTDHHANDPDVYWFDLAENWQGYGIHTTYVVGYRVDGTVVDCDGTPYDFPRNHVSPTAQEAMRRAVADAEATAD